MTSKSFISVVVDADDAFLQFRKIWEINSSKLEGCYDIMKVQTCLKNQTFSFAYL